MGNFRHRRMGCGREVLGKVGVSEGRVPTGGERAVVKVDEAEPKIGVQESTAHEVGTFKGGGSACGCGVGV